MSISRVEFDPIAVAVDWLDAGKLGDLDGLLDLYDERATLECDCEGVVLTGRKALSAYWVPKLDNLFAAASLGDMILTGDGVQLDCQNYEGKPVRFLLPLHALRENRAYKLRSVGKCRLGSYPLFKSENPASDAVRR